MGAGLIARLAVVAALAAALIAGCSPSPAVSPSGPVDLGDPAEFARALFDETNLFRASNELTQLEWSDCLASAAAPRAQDSLGTTPLSHAPLPSPCTEGATAGENLSRTWQSAGDVVGLWMNSEAHRANILNPDFTHSAIACVPYAHGDASLEAAPGDPQGGMVCSQLFEGD